MVTLVKTKSHTSKGECKETLVDNNKKAVDFRLVQTSPYYIVWNNTGKGEIVNKRTLNKLQKNHTWATDF
jgi:hypothetical protein